MRNDSFMAMEIALKLRCKNTSAIVTLCELNLCGGQLGLQTLVGAATQSLGLLVGAQKISHFREQWDSCAYVKRRRPLNWVEEKLASSSVSVVRHCIWRRTQ